MGSAEVGGPRLTGSAARALRLGASGLLAGMVAGGLAGLGSRLAMFVVRLMNPSHNGEVTHAAAEVGRVTFDGTLSLVVEGAFYGVPGAVVYLVVRGWIPGDGAVKGLLYGLFLLVVAGPVVLDGNYEFFRYVSPLVGVGLFGALYPLYGLVVAPLTERWGRGEKGPPGNRVAAFGGWSILGGLTLWSLGRDYTILRDVFHLFT